MGKEVVLARVAGGQVILHERLAALIGPINEPPEPLRLLPDSYGLVKELIEPDGTTLLVTDRPEEFFAVLSDLLTMTT